MTLTQFCFQAGHAWRCWWVWSTVPLGNLTFPHSSSHHSLPSPTQANSAVFSHTALKIDQRTFPWLVRRLWCCWMCRWRICQFPSPYPNHLKISTTSLVCQYCHTPSAHQESTIQAHFHQPLLNLSLKVLKNSCLSPYSFAHFVLVELLDFEKLIGRCLPSSPNFPYSSFHYILTDLCHCQSCS